MTRPRRADLAHHNPGRTPPVTEIKPAAAHPRAITPDEKYRAILNDVVALGDLVGAVATELGISAKADTAAFIAAIRARDDAPEVERLSKVEQRARVVRDSNSAQETYWQKGIYAVAGIILGEEPTDV